MHHHFPQEAYERIPLIAGNNLTLNFSHILYDKLQEIKSDVVFESLTKEGVYLNRKYFFQSNTHDTKVKIILRNPRLDIAMFNHTKDDIFDYGIYHEGADIVILDNPHYGEIILKDHVLLYGYYVEVSDNKITVYQNTGLKELEFVGSLEYETEMEKDFKVLKAIEPFLPDLLKKYELKKGTTVNWNYAKF
jgi:cyanophycin synthetase